MRFIAMFLLCCLFIIGCQQQPQPQRQEIRIQTPPPDVILRVEPPIIITPSRVYLQGYDDGYYGTWLGPVKWTFNSDYRNGWSAGEWDRRNGLSHRYRRN